MKEKLKIILYCFVISFLFLLIGTKSSPLYPMNDWVDANAFFTMGKGMFNGLVPFKDLFEQKGPFLYVIYGIGYLISNTTFLGIFLIEVVSFTILLYYFYKILKLYQMKDKIYFLAPILVTIIITMKAFFSGGSAEEIALPLMMISLYHFLSLIKDKQYLKENKKIYFITGIIAGIVLWIKYTFLGFWIAFGVIFLFLFIYEKRWKQAISFCLCYLLGMIFITLPVIIYFLYHNALSDLWEVYFYFNIFLYRPSIHECSFLVELGLKVYYLFLSIMKNWIFGIFLTLGSIFVLKDKIILLKKSKLTILILFLFLYYFSFFGGSYYIYYFLILAPFAIFGVLELGKLFSKVKIYVVPICIVVCFLFTILTSDKLEFLKVEKSSLAQYKFADIMNREKNPTMLYYGGIDGGFYTVANILPTERYFERVNISYLSSSDNLDSQNDAIKNRRTQFVITKRILEKEVNNIPYLNENYELVAHEIQEYEGNDWNYFLYKRKE